MTVKYEVGDLFDPKWGFDAIGHGVNCKGVMGSGIAVEFKRRYPEMHKEYKWLCLGDYLHLGQVMPWKATDDLWIYNIASQYLPGANAKYGALVTGLYFVRYHAETNKLKRVGLPRIGAGIGGLDWMSVMMYAEGVLQESPVEFVFVSLEGQ